jgi:hypothetical protein
MGSLLLSAQLVMFLAAVACASTYDGTLYGNDLSSLILLILTIALTVAVAVLVWTGRGWARYAVVLLLEYKLWELTAYRSVWHVPSFLVCWNLHVLLMIAGFGILFSGESRAWFSHCAALRLEARAGRRRSYWMACAFGVVVLGWLAYPVNMLAPMLIGIFLGVGAEGSTFLSGDNIIFVISGLLYSAVLFGLGTVAWWFFDAARRMVVPKHRLSQ